MNKQAVRDLTLGALYLTLFPWSHWISVWMEHIPKLANDPNLMRQFAQLYHDDL